MANFASSSTSLRSVVLPLRASPVVSLLSFRWRWFFFCSLSTITTFFSCSCTLEPTQSAGKLWGRGGGQAPPYFAPFLRRRVSVHDDDDLNATERELQRIRDVISSFADGRRVSAASPSDHVVGVRKSEDTNLRAPPACVRVEALRSAAHLRNSLRFLSATRLRRRPGPAAFTFFGAALGDLLHASSFTKFSGFSRTSDVDVEDR